MTSIIKVDQIQNAAGNTIVSTDASTVTIKNPAGTTAMTIDGDGIVSTAQRPAFYITHTSGTVGLNGVIVLNNAIENVGGHYSTSTGRFSAPLTGWYQFNFNGFGCNSVGGTLASGTSGQVGLFNETTSTWLAVAYGYAGSSHHPNLSFSTTQKLNANDI